jgi:hypothetical protein
MREASEMPLVVEDPSIFTEFINLTGDISTVLYFTKHPEEKDETRRPIVMPMASTSLRKNAA